MLFGIMLRAFSILCLALFVAVSARGQGADDDLVVLPPMPNLYLGDPERPLSPKMRRALAREEERKRRAEEAEMEARKESVRFQSAGEPEEKKWLFGRSRLGSNRGQPVTNSISSIENATTADGTRLRPFGDDDYWGGIPESTEDPLVELPPMPDIRTPDQVTRREQKRNRMVANQQVRSATNQANREVRQSKRNPQVVRPASDPELALVRVRSERGSPSAGMVQAPETIRDTELQPFNEESTYYRDGFLVFRGNDKRRPPSQGLRFFKGRNNAE